MYKARNTKNENFSMERRATSRARCGEELFIELVDLQQLGLVRACGTRAATERARVGAYECASSESV